MMFLFRGTTAIKFEKIGKVGVNLDSFHFGVQGPSPLLSTTCPAFAHADFHRDLISLIFFNF